MSATPSEGGERGPEQRPVRSRGRGRIGLAGGGFAALLLATAAAFFITQHLKVSDPLIAAVQVTPSSINPVSGRVCLQGGKPVSFRRARISFYLPDHNDTAGVFIVSDSGQTVRTIAWRYMRQGRALSFYWNGRESGGGYAPDGTYYVQVALQGEGRSFNLSDDPIHVIRENPVVRLAPITIRAAGGASSTTTTGALASTPAPTTSAGATVLTPGQTVARIHFSAGLTRGARILIYRADSAGALSLLGSYRLPRNQHGTSWNGELNGRPAPAGAYLIGVRATDYACNIGSFPARTTPPLGSTAGAGVTVSYVSVATPTDPVAAGSEAALTVNHGRDAYSWTLRQAGTAKVLRSGSQPASAGSTLHMRIPAGWNGLYVLNVASAGHQLAAPLLVSGPRRAVLVVLPELTWQGENAVDSTGDGIPETLAGDDSIALGRPLIAGLPDGFADLATLLRYLTAHHLRYQLTSDIALAAGRGPTLAGHSGVLLAGRFRWLPARLAGELRRYADGGGRVLAIGLDSLTGLAAVTESSGGSQPAASTASGLRAGQPRTTTLDPFGVGRGPLATTNGERFAVRADPLSLLSSLTGATTTAGSELTGLTSVQALLAPAHTDASEIAPVGGGEPILVGLHVGKGTVVELAAAGFGASLPQSKGAQNLLGGLWKLLAS